VEDVEDQLVGTFGSVMSEKDVAMGLVLCGMVTNTMLVVGDI
jgi:hypothetical protein